MARVKIEFIGDDRSFSAAAKRVNAQLGTLESRLGRGAASAERAGRSMTRNLTLPIVGIGIAAGKMAIDFQKQMTLVQTQAGASATEVKKMSAAVLELAQTGAAQGPVELAQGLFHLESLGLRGAKAIDTLRIASTAAGMGIANLEDVTTALGGAVTSGIAGTGNYTHAMATLNATIGAGNMRMGDLTEALGTGLLPKAKNVGITLPEVGAALAVLTDRGMGAAQAGTRLGMTFAMMEKPSKSATKYLADMGISGSQLADTLRSGHGQGLQNALELLAAGMHKVGDKTRAAQDVLGAFGGGKTGGGILTLLDSLTSGLSSYEGKLGDVSAGTKKYAAQVVAYHQTAGYKIHAALASVEADLVKTGAGFAPLAVEGATALKDVADAFDQLPGPAKKAVEITAGLLAVMGPMVFVGAKLVKMVLTLRTAYLFLAGAERAIGPAAVEGATVAEAELAGVGGAADAATVQVGILRGALLALGPLAAVFAGYELLTHKKQVDTAVSGFLDHHGMGFLGGKNDVSSKLDDPAYVAKLRKTFGDKKVDELLAAARKSKGTVAANVRHPEPHDPSLGGDTTTKPKKPQDPYVAAALKMIREENARIAAAQKELGKIGGGGDTTKTKGGATGSAALKRGRGLLSDQLREQLLKAEDYQARHPGRKANERLLKTDQAAVAFLNHLNPATAALDGLSKKALAHMTVEEKHRRIEEERLAIDKERLAIDRQETGLKKKLGHAVDAHLFRAARSSDLTAGLHMSVADHKALEQRLAQAMAHNFRVPVGPAAAGYAIGGRKVDSVYIYIDGKKIDLGRDNRVRVVHRNARLAGSRPG